MSMIKVVIKILMTTIMVMIAMTLETMMMMISIVETSKRLQKQMAWLFKNL